MLFRHLHRAIQRYTRTERDAFLARIELPGETWPLANWQISTSTDNRIHVNLLRSRPCSSIDPIICRLSSRSQGPQHSTFVASDSTAIIGGPRPARSSCCRSAAANTSNTCRLAGCHWHNFGAMCNTLAKVASEHGSNGISPQTSQGKSR